MVEKNINDESKRINLKDTRQDHIDQCSDIDESELNEIRGYWKKGGRIIDIEDIIDDFRGNFLIRSKQFSAHSKDNHQFSGDSEEEEKLASLPVDGI